MDIDLGFVLPELDSFKGPDLTAKNLLNQLKNKVNEIKLITLKKYSETDPGNKWFLNGNVEIYPVLNPWNPLSLFKVKDVVEEMDLLHVPGGTVKSVFPLLSITYLAETKTVLGNACPWNDRKLKWLIKFFKPTLFLNNLHHWKQFRHYDGKAFFPHGIPLQKFHPKNSNKDLKDLHKVLWVNHLNKHKRPVLAIEAFKHLPRNFKLTIVGDGPLHKQVESVCKAVDNVEFVGPVPHNQIPEVYRDHDVSFITSRFEGSSHVAVESMATGLPLVSCTEFFSNILGKKHSIRVEPDPEKLAEGIRKVFSDQVRYSNMSRNARSHVENWFNAKDFGENMNNLYEKILSNSYSFDGDNCYKEIFSQFYREAVEGDNLRRNVLLNWPKKKRFK